MKAKMVPNNMNKFNDLVGSILTRLEEESTCFKDEETQCFCMNCRMDAGSYEEIDDGFIYETGTGFGYYEYIYNVGIYFEGRRNSFKDGTEFWNNAGIAESCNGTWEQVESSEPERDVWS